MVSPSTSAPDGWLEVGHVRRPHGLRGDAYVQLSTDRVERLEPGAELWARGQRLVVVRSRRAGSGRWIAGFDSIEDRTSIERFNNEPLFAAPLSDEDALWAHDLIGCKVVDQDGVDRGRCVAVVENPASDLLELTSGALVPTDFVVGLDDGSGVIRVEVPTGLFDLFES